MNAGFRPAHLLPAQGIQWSTDEVYKRTQRNAEAAGMTVAPRTALPVLQDIDFIEVISNNTLSS